jgi:hypothetical protein
VTRSLLVFRQDEFEVFRVVDGVKDGKDGASGVAENMFHIVPEHHLMKDLATGLSNEPEST